MATHLEAAFAFDVKIRIADDNAPAAGGHLRASEVASGVVYAQDGVTVTAFPVDHRPVEPALGYRIEFQGRTIVLSGDTRPSDELVRMAQGVDLLIHEVALATPAELAQSPLSRSVVAHHTTPAEAGGIFRRTRPKLAVYSHIVLRPGAVATDLLPVTRAVFDGPVLVGADLMQFTITDSVRVTSAAGGA
jgi:ribonuclease Z